MDLLLHNLRTIGTHHCDASVGIEAAEEIERLINELEELKRYISFKWDNQAISHADTVTIAPGFSTYSEHQKNDKG